ncbi:hypothetical protein Lfu02_34290 [Longispora fulva]|uniref:Uncharacterized protein n=1 Tax=Longispora fulva TaxID=619741 RepID=A0A8J7GR14_9ACTN|nr:hypothetical protein [Longispora fulva]MBG6141788.1 hypothetical protein [Longispora fulva]GIG59057.1 hypothetical protein Lfu02_34290 [Longispora fulva]
MSFASSAARVRNPDLPWGRRVNALGSCVQIYRPLGFNITLSLLTRLAGPYARDEATLLAALDLLSASRAARHRASEAYAARRTAAKRAGRRVPGPDEPYPHRSLRWDADPREGALHALWCWTRRHFAALTATGHPAAVDLRGLATTCLTTGRLDPADRSLLALHVRALRRPDSTESFTFRQRHDLLTIAEHITTADETAP